MGGIGSGGYRGNSGRPPGARNIKARELLATAERDNLQTPIGFLLGVMRDPALPLHDRMMAANICMPYLHPRLSATRIIADPAPMTDEQLVAGIAQLEVITAAMRESDPVAAGPATVTSPIEPAPRPGAVIQRPGEVRHHQATPTPLDQRRLRYDPVGKRMVSVLS